MTGAWPSQRAGGAATRAQGAPAPTASRPSQAGTGIDSGPQAASEPAPASRPRPLPPPRRGRAARPAGGPGLSRPRPPAPAARPLRLRLPGAAASATVTRRSQNFGTSLMRLASHDRVRLTSHSGRKPQAARKHRRAVARRGTGVTVTVGSLAGAAAPPTPRSLSDGQPGSDRATVCGQCDSAQSDAAARPGTDSESARIRTTQCQ